MKTCGGHFEFRNMGGLIKVPYRVLRFQHTIYSPKQLLRWVNINILKKGGYISKANNSNEAILHIPP